MSDHEQTQLVEVEPVVAPEAAGDETTETPDSPSLQPGPGQLDIYGQEVQ